MGRKNKPRLIPEQDKRICGSICFCQLTIVLSCVSIVYLSVAIYLPSYKAFQSGFEPQPVMCQTINNTMANNCPWASCGEWCLTKTSGFCPQIHATVRRNGTDIQLENCTRITTTACPQVVQNALKKFNCNNGTECASLSGVFNCSLGHCKNMSELYLCHHKADGNIIDAEKDNLKLNGFFECTNSRCKQIKKHFSCDRYCPKITTTAVNVLIMQDDTLVTAECDVGYGYNVAKGPEPGVRVPEGHKIWDENFGILLTNCFDVIRDGDRLNATDCVNGTLLNYDDLPHPYMNFTQFWKIYENSTTVLDQTESYLPRQSSLTIYNTSRLYINLEGCVNTLRGECSDFLHFHGRDGDNNTAQSRFRCFYNKYNPFYVVTRFDLSKTWRELLIAVCVPATLFVISFITLCIITQSVKVGDDAKMRCKYCTDGNSDTDDLPKPNSCQIDHEPLSPTSTIGDQAINIELTIPSNESSPRPPLPSTSTDMTSIGEPAMLQSSTKSLIPLSPCTEITEKSLSVSATIELQEDILNDKPLVEL